MEFKQPAIDLQNIHCLLIDLDDTLYPRSKAVSPLIRERIIDYMTHQMDFSEDEVPVIHRRLFREYGTTLRGLQKEYTVDMDTFLSYVFDIPIESVLAPDPDLDRLLHSLPQRKVIFTNSPAFHAERVLEVLNVADHFDTILDVYATFPYCKPDPEAFQIALDLIDENPENCLMFEDSPDNLKTAQTLGIATVSIGKYPHDGSPHFETFHEIESLFSPDRS